MKKRVIAAIMSVIMILTAGCSEKEGNPKTGQAGDSAKNAAVSMGGLAEAGARIAKAAEKAFQEHLQEAGSGEERENKAEEGLAEAGVPGAVNASGFQSSTDSGSPEAAEHEGNRNANGNKNGSAAQQGGQTAGQQPTPGQGGQTAGQQPTPCLLYTSGVFSGGEIHCLRRLGQRGLTRAVLVGVGS